MPGRALTTQVRAAELDDIDDLARINVATWRSAYTAIVPERVLNAMSVADRRDRWRGILAPDNPGDVTVVVGELDGLLASYAVFGGYRAQQDADPDEDTAGWGEILAVYTDPLLQGRGVGTALMTAALATLAEAGFHTAALWVLAANERSRAWYARRGWTADGATSMWDADGTRLPEVRLVRPVP